MASYRRHDHLKPSRRISGLGFLSIVVIIAIIATVSLTFSRWEAQPPEVKFDRELKSMGKDPALNLTVADAGSGLDKVTVRLKQKAGEVVLVDETLMKEPSRSYDLGKLMAAGIVARKTF